MSFIENSVGFQKHFKAFLEVSGDLGGFLDHITQLRRNDNLNDSHRGKFLPGIGQPIPFEPKTVFYILFLSEKDQLFLRNVKCQTRMLSLTWQTFNSFMYNTVQKPVPTM